MWRLRFLEADAHGVDKGAWFVSLALMEHSPSTFLDSHLLINDVWPHSPSKASTPSISSKSPKSLFSSPEPKPNQPIELRLKTAGEQLTAPVFAGAHQVGYCPEICVPLSKSPMGHSLQFECVCPCGRLSCRPFFGRDAC